MTSTQIERSIIQSRLAAAIAQRAKGPIWEPLRLDEPSREIAALEAMLLQMDNREDDFFH
jgi:hypothetical protein